MALYLQPYSTDSKPQNAKIRTQIFQFFCMVQGLSILNNYGVGCRDLWWRDDPSATSGYNIYRSFDTPGNWVKLNSSPQPGHFYRDATMLTPVSYTATAADFIERGELGGWGIRIPDVPYANVVSGRPSTASSLDVSVSYDSVSYTPLRVDGLSRIIWLDLGESLPSGGAVSNFPYPDPSTVTSFSVSYNKMTNFVDVYTSLTRTYYTVTSVGANGEINAPGSTGLPVVNSQEIGKMDYIQARMVDYNNWMFEQVGEPAWLMFRRTKGTVCGCTLTNQNNPRSACPSCYETGIVGGYYGPFDFLFITPDTAITRTAEEGGVKVERRSRSVLGPTPIVQNGDMIVRRNGERLVISNVAYVMPKGVLLLQEFDAELRNTRDTRYLVPVNIPKTDTNGNPLFPAVYNPALESVTGGEPVMTPLYPSWTANTVYGAGSAVYVSGFRFESSGDGISSSTPPTWNFTIGQTTTDNTVSWVCVEQIFDQKTWQNPTIPVGRTVSFGNIMTS